MSASVHSIADIPGVWRGERPLTPTPVESTGIRDLDRVLLGGWPRGSLVQISGPDEGLGLSLIIDSLARLTQSGRYIALVQTPMLPFAPALALRGIDLKQVAWIQPQCSTDALWAMEQMTRSGLFAAVAYWGPALDSTAERRLQLAADTGQCTAFCFRATLRDDHTYAAVRLAVTPTPDAALQVDVQKCRGRNAGQRLRYRCPEAIEAQEA